jgi:Putative prokaryotic signal transducing protein
MQAGGVDEMESSDLVVVSTFRSVADAQIAKGILDETGVASMIRSDNAGGMYPGVGVAELLVRAEDIQRANESLNRRDRPSR